MLASTTVVVVQFYAFYNQLEANQTKPTNGGACASQHKPELTSSVFIKCCSALVPNLEYKLCAVLTIICNR